MCRLNGIESRIHLVNLKGGVEGSTKAVYCQTMNFHHKTRTYYALTATYALQGKGQSENSCSMPNWFCNNSAHSDNNCALILAHAHTQFLSFTFRLFSVESYLKCCDVKGGRGVKS